MRKILLLFLVISNLFASAQSTSGDKLRQRSLTLRRFLEQNHYQPVQWNDSLSARLYNRWLDLLDDEKLIFSQNEIAQLIPYKARLDDELAGREWNFFNKTISLYKTCLLRADSMIKNILAKPLDFSAPGNINWPLSVYPDSRDELYQAWLKYLKWKVLRSISDEAVNTFDSIPGSATQPPNFAQLEIKSREQIKKKELLWIQNTLNKLEQPFNEMEENYLSSICWCYDPHTSYMSAETKNDFETEMSGLEFSAGFEMDVNEKAEWVITYLVPGGPAWRNGELHKGDILLKIRSGDKPELVLANTGISQLGNILAGSSNEKITITVQTANGTQKTTVLSKEKITNEEGVVKSYILNGPKKIGYITLPGFYVKEGDEDKAYGCSNDVAKEVLKLKKDSIAGLILDLRYNGGGSLGEALELAGIFISEGTLTSTKDKTGKLHFLKDPNRGIIYDGPMLVMLNGASASASELVAAVLQDYHRALVVGSPSYGKGSSQVILPMDTTGSFSKTTKYDSYVKVTTGKFYRVDGTTTQWKGVIPDIELPDMDAIDKSREKNTISALQPDMSKASIYHPLPPIPIDQLKLKSNSRVNADNLFKAILKFSDWRKSMGAYRSIPLQWVSYNNYYQKIASIFKTIEDEEANTNKLPASNNSLDREQQHLVSEQSKAINDINLQRIERDNYIAESFRIIQDWLK